MPPKLSPAFSAQGYSIANLLVDGPRARTLKDMALNLPDIVLNDMQLGNYELLSIGAFSPLNGFMRRADYESVLDRMRMQDGTFWPIPICLDISETQARSLDIGQSVTLRDPEGFLLAIMHIEDIWPIDKEKEIAFIWNADGEKRQKAQDIMPIVGDYYVGGQIEALSLPVHYDSRKLRNTPKELFNVFTKLNWKRIIGYPTLNPIHRSQYKMTLMAMKQAKANLLILPIEGITKPSDFDYFTRIRCYRAISGYYPPDSLLINLLPLSLPATGGRDTLLKGIIAKNYGCTHLLVEQEGATAGDFQSDDRSEQQGRMNEYFKDIGIIPISFKEIVYLPFEDDFREIDSIPSETQTISLTPSDIYERIRTGKNIPSWATFPKVYDELQKAHPPQNKKGFTLFLTGLSGAGKSTIAKVLYSIFQEIGSRPVTLLDGDIVRQNLSSQLSFTKEDRDINVRRIGFVAGEITKNRGIAICAPIAPYNATRREIRERIELYGGFIEVHVSTPLEECEKRDRKGWYAKARAGLVKDFTGIDDPYEVPENPELRIDTTSISPDEAAQEILLVLSQKGYIQ